MKSKRKFLISALAVVLAAALAGRCACGGIGSRRVLLLQGL